MNKTNLIIGIIASIALILGIFGAVGNKTVVIKDADGLRGTTADDWNVSGNLAITGTTALTGAATLSGALTVTGDSTLESTIVGGTVYSTTTFGTGLLTAANICDNSIIRVTLGTATTLRLPSTTTLAADCLPNVGDEKWISIVNASSSDTGAFGGAEMITLAVPTGDGLGGIDLLGTSTDSKYFADSVRLYLNRETTATTSVFIHNFQNAD